MSRANLNFQKHFSKLISDKSNAFSSCITTLVELVMEAKKNQASQMRHFLVSIWVQTSNFIKVIFAIASLTKFWSCLWYAFKDLLVQSLDSKCIDEFAIFVLTYSYTLSIDVYLSLTQIGCIMEMKGLALLCCTLKVSGAMIRKLKRSIMYMAFVFCLSLQWICPFVSNKIK